MLSRRWPTANELSDLPGGSLGHSELMASSVMFYETPVCVDGYFSAAMFLVLLLWFFFLFGFLYY